MTFGSDRVLPSRCCGLDDTELRRRPFGWEAEEERAATRISLAKNSALANICSKRNSAAARRSLVSRLAFDMTFGVRGEFIVVEEESSFPESLDEEDG